MQMDDYKIRWEKGKRLCLNCEDSLKGVVIENKYGWGPYLDEPRDKTGE